MKNRRNVFASVGSLNVGRSLFDLSYEKKFTGDMGKLYPVMADEVVPGDIFNISNRCVVRFQPMVAPVLHEVNVYTHYFFVPYRLLWGSWEDFITSGIEGDDASALPTWHPTDTSIGSLWDFLGFPTGIDPEGARPVVFPQYAYNLIYNEYYIDEQLSTVALLTGESIHERMWEKDYFTSSLPWQQKGTSPALPISGVSSAQWPTDHFVNAAPGTPVNVQTNGGAANSDIYLNSVQGRLNAISFFNGENVVDLSAATTFDIADLRLSVQIQKWLERNARGGTRYTEFLRSHFGIAPKDERMQRPEYIGGTVAPVIFSEVLQTSETTVNSSQGNLAGHGLTVGSGFVGKYRVNEYGLIMGILSVMPKAVYQDGVNRQWIKSTRYDFYSPEFANLSEQAIIRAEICARNHDAASNQTIFGYQGHWDELRTKQNMVCSNMRSDFDFWHLSRQFDPASPPSLNATFLRCIPDKRIFQVTTEDGLIINYANIIQAWRPIPAQAEPGLIDH